MKKAILVVLWLLLSLILPACGPMMTYEELSAEAERTGDNTKLERFERQVEKAEAHFKNKALCSKTSGVLWYCSRGASVKPQRRNQPPKSIEAIVRDYRTEKFAGCGCVTASALRQILRGY